MKRLLLALLVVPCVVLAQSRTEIVPRGAETVIPGATGATTTAGELYVAGKPHRVVARATSGTYNATVTVYGINQPCDGSCTSSDGTSLGTITTDGGTLDINTATRYLYVFSLVTSYTSGTIRADVSPLEDFFSVTP